MNERRNETDEHGSKDGSKEGSKGSEMSDKELPPSKVAELDDSPVMDQIKHKRGLE